jgi:hypothetical protein
LKVRGNVRRGVSARLKRCAEAAGTSESSEGGEREGNTSRDREVEEPIRVGSRKRQADSAATQDSGAPHAVSTRVDDAESAREDGPGSKP